MATCTVSGVVQDLSGTAISGASVKARLITPVFVTTIQIIPYEVSTTTDANGAWSLSLVQTTQAMVTIQYFPNSTDSASKATYAITVPASGTANFSTLALEA